MGTNNLGLWGCKAMAHIVSFQELILEGRYIWIYFLVEILFISFLPCSFLFLVWFLTISKSPTIPGAYKEFNLAVLSSSKISIQTSLYKFSLPFCFLDHIYLPSYTSHLIWNYSTFFLFPTFFDYAKTEQIFLAILRYVRVESFWNKKLSWQGISVSFKS